MNVARPILGALEDNRVHQPHQRRVGNAVVGLEVVEQLALGDDLHVLERRRLRRQRLARTQHPLDLGQDLVARSDTQLDLMAGRQLQLVDAADVRRIGDDDVQALAGDLVGQSDDAFEHVDGNGGGSVRRDLHIAERDQRQVEMRGLNLGHPRSGNGAVLDQSRDERARGASLGARFGKLVGSDEPGGFEQVSEQLGEGVYLPRVGKRARAAARTSACTTFSGLAVVGHIPRTSYRQLGRTS